MAWAMPQAPKKWNFLGIYCNVSFFIIFSSCVCGAGDGIKGLAHAMQALYH
jgi:hypothetical protein